MGLTALSWASCLRRRLWITPFAKNLDLVKIAPQATPPVCKIIDYGKYRFEQAKREKEARKNQRVVEIKEVRLSLNIDTHDFETKVGHAMRFLKEGEQGQGFHPFPRP